MILRMWAWLHVLTLRPRRRDERQRHHADQRIAHRDHVIADIRRQVARIERAADPFND